MVCQAPTKGRSVLLEPEKSFDGPLGDGGSPQDFLGARTEPGTGTSKRVVHHKCAENVLHAHHGPKKTVKSENLLQNVI